MAELSASSSDWDRKSVAGLTLDTKADRHDLILLINMQSNNHIERELKQVNTESIKLVNAIQS